VIDLEIFNSVGQLFLLHNKYRFQSKLNLFQSKRD